MRLVFSLFFVFPPGIFLRSSARGVQIGVAQRAAECYLITCFWETAGNATKLGLV